MSEFETGVYFAIAVGAVAYAIRWEMNRRRDYRAERDRALARRVGRVGREAVGVKHLVERSDLTDRRT